jgi:hypothetical protein
MDQEVENGSFTILVSNAQEMAEAATGDKVRILQKIKSKRKSLFTTGEGN